MSKEFIIGFSSPKNIKFPVYANLIRWIYKTEYSHVYVKIHSAKYERNLIYESVGKGTRFINEQNWKDHAISIREFSLQITDEQKVKIMQACIDSLGMKYSIKQAIGIGIKKLCKLWFNKEINNPFKTKNEEICSEAAAEILNVLKKGSFNKEEVSPQDIYNYLISLEKSKNSITKE